MLHSLPHLMAFRRQDLETYRRVNRRFAEHLAPLIEADDRIWVHDYHLMCLPGQLRQRGVRNPTGFFLHVPFPSPEAAAVAPGIRGLLADVLAADMLGFQTAADRDNFAASAVELRRRGAHRRLDDAAVDGREVRLGVFPAEISAREFAATAEAQARAEPSRLLARSIQGQALLLGVDRLDPTKGLPERLEAFRRLVARRPGRRLAFLQIAAPSREEVDAYRRLREEIDMAAGAINSEFGEPDWLPMRLLARPQARDTLAGFMRLARVGVVTPLRDGMNLVAKEYVAAQDPEDPGVLVLSRFAGAAAQLGSVAPGQPARRGGHGGGAANGARHAARRAPGALARRLERDRGRVARGLGRAVPAQPRPGRLGGDAGGRPGLSAARLGADAAHRAHLSIRAEVVAPPGPIGGGDGRRAADPGEQVQEVGERLPPSPAAQGAGCLGGGVGRQDASGDGAAKGGAEALQEPRRADAGDGGTAAASPPRPGPSRRPRPGAPGATRRAASARASAGASAGAGAGRSAARRRCRPPPARAAARSAARR